MLGGAATSRAPRSCSPYPVNSLDAPIPYPDLEEVSVALICNILRETGRALGLDPVAPSILVLHPRDKGGVAIGVDGNLRIGRVLPGGRDVLHRAQDIRPSAPSGSVASRRPSGGRDFEPCVIPCQKHHAGPANRRSLTVAVIATSPPASRTPWSWDRRSPARPPPRRAEPGSSPRSPGWHP